MRSLAQLPKQSEALRTRRLLARCARQTGTEAGATPFVARPNSLR
jgi:hypothetical protein